MMIGVSFITSTEKVSQDPYRVQAKQVQNLLKNKANKNIQKLSEYMFGYFKRGWF